MAIEEQVTQSHQEHVSVAQLLLETPLPASAPLSPLPEEGAAPLAAEQTALWFAQQLDPSSTADQEVLVLTLRGPLQHQALLLAAQQLLRRHDILRTTFPLLDDQVRQVVAPLDHDLPSLPLLDLSHLPAQQREATLLQVLTQQQQQPFQPTIEPPWRWVLLHFEAQEHVLLLVLHALIADEPSRQLVARELGLLYAACATNQPCPLPELTLQYPAYARWQQQRLADGSRTDPPTSGAEPPAGTLPLLDLPFDRPRSSERTSPAGRVELPLTLSLAHDLQTLSQQQGVPLLTTLLTAFAVLLFRYTHQEELLLGLWRQDRPRQELDSLLGCFQQTLAVRADLAGSPTFADLLTRIQAVTRDALASQETILSPQLVTRWSVLVTQALAPLAEQEHAGVTFRLREVAPLTTSADLTLRLGQLTAQGLTLWLDYARDLFEPTTIQQLAGHLQRVLEAMTGHPEQPITTFALLTPAQWQQQIVSWNATARPYPLEQPFAALFSAQVARTPTAVAVTCAGQSLSYRQLDAQANRLAHHLQALGVGPETLVALLDERGIPLLIAILAVFKAGGAYLPLDPHHPPARLRQILSQSQCSLVLAAESLTSPLQAVLQDIEPQSRPRCLPLQSPTQGPDHAPDCAATASSLAYVIYTSGSTGLPKGAQIEQRGMLNHLFAKIEALNLDAGDCVAQTASQCFDISVWQFLAALLVGGRVQILADALAHDPTRLLEHTEQLEVSILETVPSLLRALLEIAEAAPSQRPPLRHLRWLIPTGEALPAELCRRWLSLSPSIPLLNAYGPTECSDDVTHAVISQPPAEHIRIAPIGRALANTRLYILDQADQPVPVGVSGQLCVGGLGVGRGYRGDPQRTAQVFGNDPFASSPDARLYRTGDLARFQADGSIEFLGRIDQQVKIRGNRIELGEIEAVLTEHPAIREATLTTAEVRPGDPQLVAYLVADPEADAAAGTETELLTQVRTFLQTRLPAYMLPTFFVVLPALPLTPNGKIDRRALPLPDLQEQRTGERFEAPISALEQHLARIWEDLLGVGPIGRQEDFFRLGGHSLLAVRLIQRIEQVCGQKLALSTLFAGATIAHLAAALQAEIPTDARAPIVAVQAQGSKPPFFFLHGEWNGGAFYCLELARTLGSEQPFYLLEPYRFEGLKVPPSLETMAAAHLTSVQAIQPSGPYLLGGWCNGGIIAYEMARQLRAQGQQVDLLVLMDPDAPTLRERKERLITSKLGKLLRLTEEKQVDGFLFYRYLRLSFYYWRLRKFALKRASQADEPASEQIAANALLPEADDEMLEKDAFRQDWSSLYHWALTGYIPRPYAGKITFFWTDEELFRREGWQKAMEIHTDGYEKDIHIIPGNHITSRTQYLSILAEHLRLCLNKAQLILMN